MLNILQCIISCLFIFICILESKHSRSTLLNPERVTDKVRKEISKGRIAGPFTEKSFGDKFKCSPLAIREK